MPEKDKQAMAKVSGMSVAQIKSLLLRNPVNYLRNIVVYDPDQEELRFTERINNELNDETIQEIRNVAYKHLYHYYKDFDPHQLKLQELDDLPIGTAADQQCSQAPA